MTTQPVVRQRGTIVAVQLVQRGGVITATSGVTLTLTNAADFPRDGGLVLIEGEATPRVYESVTEGLTADDPDVLNLTDPAPVINADTRADLYPAAWDMWADVEAPETGGAIRAIVPHNLRAVLPEGVRELAAREVVEVELDGWTWRLRDVLGRRGEVESSAVLGLDDALTELHDNLDTAAADLITARDALEAADVALGDRLTAAEGTLDTDLGALGDAMTQLGLDLANLDVVARIPVDGFPADRIIADTVLASKVSGVMGAFQSVFANKVVASMITADVSMANKVVGLMGSFGSVFANAITSTMLNVDTALVQKLTAKFATVQELFAGVFTGDSIRGGKIEGTDIYSPSSVSANRIHLGAGVLETIRQNEDGAEFTGTVLGGATSDQLALYNSVGLKLSGFDDEGQGLAQTMAVASRDFTVSGENILDRLDALPRGNIANQRYTSGSFPRFNANEVGLFEIGGNLAQDRLYRISGSWTMWCATASRAMVRLRFVVGNPGTEPAAPTISSTELRRWYVYLPPSQWVTFSGEELYRGQYSNYVGRFVWTVVNDGGNYEVQIPVNQGSAVTGLIEDIGSVNNGAQADGNTTTAGGTPASGGTSSAPPITKKTTTSVWNADWVMTYRSGGQYTSADNLEQGNWGSVQRYSMIHFPSAVQTALSGSSIAKIEVWLENLSWYQNSGGKALIGRHQNTSAPGVPQTSGGSAFATTAANSGSDMWAAGTGKWVTLPIDWYSRFAVGTGSGGATGITLGEGAGTNGLYYGKFKKTFANIKLRATYTK